MSARLERLLDELEEQVARARDHEDVMQAALAESASWSQADDREWVRRAAADARDMRLAAEGRLAQGRRIAARADEGLAP
jgi:hypothetical protein